MITDTNWTRDQRIVQGFKDIGTSIDEITVELKQTNKTMIEIKDILEGIGDALRGIERKR